MHRLLLEQRGQSVDHELLREYSRDELRHLISAMVNDGAGKPISQKQIAYILDLAQSIGVIFNEDKVASLDCDMARQIIEELKEHRTWMRFAMYMHTDYWGFTPAEITIKFGVHVNTVHAAVAYARRALGKWKFDDHEASTCEDQDTDEPKPV